MSTYQVIFSGVARLESFRGRLRVRFPRSLFDGREKTLALGLPDSPKYRAIASNFILEGRLLDRCLLPTRHPTRHLSFWTPVKLKATI